MRANGCAVVSRSLWLAPVVFVVDGLLCEFEGYRRDPRDRICCELDSGAVSSLWLKCRRFFVRVMLRSNCVDVVFALVSCAAS